MENFTRAVALNLSTKLSLARHYQPVGQVRQEGKKIKKDMWTGKGVTDFEPQGQKLLIMSQIASKELFSFLRFLPQPR
jgi:hypothetical protein